MAGTRREMSRATRTWRGALAASIATLVAAASHSVAGGSISPIAVLATAVLALPVCVALAGRLGSLWRVSLAVIASQVPYHWTFWGLGLGNGAETGASATGHAAHLAAGFDPSAVVIAAPAAAMWASHSLAALCTIALLHLGERAWQAIVRVVHRVLPLRLPGLVASLPLPVVRPCGTAVRATIRRLLDSTTRYRGPPHAPAFAI